MNWGCNTISSLRHHAREHWLSQLDPGKVLTTWIWLNAGWILRIAGPSSSPTLLTTLQSAPLSLAGAEWKQRLPFMKLALNPWLSSWGGNLGSMPAHHPEEPLMKIYLPGCRCWAMTLQSVESSWLLSVATRCFNVFVCSVPLVTDKVSPF